MRLNIKVTLDTGGTLEVRGEDLSAEDVNEVFRVFAGHPIESGVVRAREQQGDTDELHQDREHGSIRND